MKDNGNDVNEANIPAIQNGEGDRVRNDAAVDDNNTFQPLMKRRKRSESDPRQ